MLTNQSSPRSPGHLMDLDLARHVRGPRQETCVVVPLRLDMGGDLGRVPQKPDLARRPHCNPAVPYRHTHGTLEVMERKDDLTTIEADHPELARLVGRH